MYNVSGIYICYGRNSESCTDKTQMYTEVGTYLDLINYPVPVPIYKL